MPTIEQSVKSQFAKVFSGSDWALFKKMAEANFREAAALKNSDMLIEDSLKLLARNSRKRLLIGVGAELLLKAIYLKHGFAINKPAHKDQITFPFTFSDARPFILQPDRTYMLYDLIENLGKIVQLSQKEVVIRGLTIAKVFRNKEGHTATATHSFDASNYSDIASAVVVLYRDAFRQKLSLQFSVAHGQSSTWELDAL